MIITRGVIRRTAYRVVFLLLLTSCRELPDIKPFANATEELKATVGKGKMMANTLFTAYKEDNSTSNTTKTTLDAGIQKLDADWKTTDEGLSALVNYATALAEVAAAGQSGDAAVKNVFDALSGLSSVIPLNPIADIGGATQVAQVIGKAVIKAKAAKNLREATEAADSAVAVSAKVISQNLDDMRKLVHNLGRNYETIGIAQENAWLINYYNALLANEQHQAILLTAIVNLEQVDQSACSSVLKKKFDDLKGSIPPSDIVNTCNANGGNAASDFVISRNTLRKDALEFAQRVEPAFLSDTSFEAAARRATKLNRAVLQSAQLNHAEQQRIEPQYAKVAAQMADIHKTTDNTAAVFNAASKAVAAMAQSHTSLVKSLSADYTHFSFKEFTSFVQEAADAYKKGSK